MTLILSGTDNSVSSPAVQGGTGGTTTGVYYPATNQLALATNGTQAVLVDSSQNVGIGTSSPGYNLNVYGSSPIIVAQDNGANGTRALIQATNTAVYFGNTYSGGNVPIVFSVGGGSGGTERMRITSTGNLTFSTSNAGIVFNNSSATTNSTLNDYEAGTWSVSIVGTPSNMTSVSVTNGRYTKIGNLVTLTANVSSTITATNTETNLNLQLPFAATSSSWGASGAFSGYVGTGVNRFMPATFFNGSGSSGSFVLYIPGVLVNNTGSMTGMFTFTYQASF